MATKLRLVGEVFWRIKVISETEAQNQNSRWLCICQCGKTVKVLGWHLTTGKTKSCGCLRREITEQRNKRLMTKHGHCKNGRNTRAYTIWQGMRYRCHNENSKDYFRYGGRGIKVCQKWKNSFDEFYYDMGVPPKGMQLDRIDPNGNYQKDNCRWVTPTINARNRRRDIMAERQKKCDHKRSKDFLYCPMCGAEFASVNPDGSKAGVNNAA